MRRQIACVLVMMALVVGVLASPANASGHCEKGGTKSVVARVDLDGASFDGNHGLQVRMDVYQAYVRRPALFAPDAFSLHVMYAADAPNRSGFQEYIEFGWQRTRGIGSYGPIEAIVVHTTPSGQVVHKLGTLIKGSHVFRMFYDGNGTGLWQFRIDGVLRYSLASPSLGNYVYHFVSSEATDSCNGLAQSYTGAKRFSTANNAWINLGLYDVGFNQYTDNNNHHSGVVPQLNGFEVYCDPPAGDTCEELQT